MRTLQKLISSLILALVAIGGASAQTKEEAHKAHHPQTAASASGETPAADMTSKPAGMGSMHDMHARHQEEMKRIQAIKDPAKRQKLMDKHMKEMHEHMDKNGGMDKGSNMGMMATKPMQDAANK